MPRLLPALVTTLCLSGMAHAEAPRCGDPDLIKNFQGQALDTINFYVTAIYQMEKKVPTSTFDAKLTRMYQLSESEAERTCSGSLVITEDDQSTDMQVEYSVIATEDGQSMFQWSPPRGWVDRLFLWLPQPKTRQFTAEEIANTPPTAADMARQWSAEHPDSNRAYDPRKDSPQPSSPNGLRPPAISAPR